MRIGKVVWVVDIPEPEKPVIEIDNTPIEQPVKQPLEKPIPVEMPEEVTIERK